MVVILTWIYYSALILTFGAEFTKVFANTYGSKIRPADNAQFFVSRPIRQIEPQPILETAGSLPAELPVQHIRASRSATMVSVGMLGLAFGLLLSYLATLLRRD